jgi:hypothetical protein
MVAEGIIWLNFAEEQVAPKAPLLVAVVPSSDVGRFSLLAQPIPKIRLSQLLSPEPLNKTD